MSQYRSHLTQEQLRDSLAQYRLARLQEKIAADLRAAELAGEALLEARLRARKAPVLEWSI